jgi:hypothetical protein
MTIGFSTMALAPLESPSLSSRSLTGPTRSASAVIATGNEVLSSESKESADLYGNEVSDAVARFKLDDGGSLYEVHSPQTELPNLKAPVS